jgi:hypothetical protein
VDHRVIRNPESLTQRHKDHKERQWVIVMMRLTWLVIHHFNATH